MSPEEIRLRCLELARPEGLSNPDAAQIVTRAIVFEAYVTGHAEKSAPGKRGAPTGRKAAENGPA
jgi:hypothetical protein